MWSFAGVFDASLPNVGTLGWVDEWQRACERRSALASARELLGREGRLNRLVADQTLRVQLVDIPVIRVDSHVELERLDDRLTGIDGTGVDEFFLLFLRYGGAIRLIGDAQRAARAKRRTVTPLSVRQLITR